MKDIILVSINARYSHAALGVRCLLANMGDLRNRTALEEFVIQDSPRSVAERILSHRPGIVGISLAIWNVTTALKVMDILKAVSPGIQIVAGGPEVRWADHCPENADFLIRGEGESAFPQLCGDLLSEPPSAPPTGTIIDGGLPALENIELPYGEYSDEDLKQRIISVETSRGCPFSCEFCLSSREENVRTFNPDFLLDAFDDLLNRGCRGYKFIDRTFNLNIAACRRILDFFLDRWPRDESGNLISPRSSRQVGQGSKRSESLFLHFEVVPDRFNRELIESLARFPAGGIQLEMGIQTLDPEVGRRIGRRVDADEAARSIQALREHTGVHIHTDLIMGLPGEDEAGIAGSFDALRAMGPHEIQMGILKLLPGAPIARHNESYRMVYNGEAPYDILQTDRISFLRMQELKRFARYFDVFANSGKFETAMARIMGSRESAFEAFDDFSSWLWNTTGQEHAMAQSRQYGLVLDYLVTEMTLEKEEAGGLLAADYLRIGSERYMPEALRPFFKEEPSGSRP